MAGGQSMIPKLIGARGVGIAALTLCCFPKTAMATPTSIDGTPGADTKLRYDLTLDLSITIGSAVHSVALELLNPELAPSACRWCDRDASGRDTLNGFDASMREAFRWPDTERADITSTVFSYVLAPLTGVGVGAWIAWYDDRLEELPLDLLIVAEAAIIAVNVNQVTKFIAGRERPNVHARSPEERLAARKGSDNLSFFSGHTTLAFALATSAGTVATMRRHRLAPVMWVSGMMLATASGYLRIAADRHYATDVITGALVGSALGFGIPYFAHRPLGDDMRVAVLPLDHGGVLAVGGVW